jgi:redox-sensitive bicupin YhaK (pirin superfamily)
MGNGSIIEPGDVQRMSAGRGVLHSEFNPSREHPVHFLQIWIEPDVTGIRPSYEQKRIDAAAKRGRLTLIASPDGRDGSVTIHQDAYVYATLLRGDERVEHVIDPERRGYVHVARGRVRLDGTVLEAGDAAKLEGPARVMLTNGDDAEVLLFDLP